MELKALMKLLLFVTVVLTSDALANSNTINSRHVRSPQKRGNLAFCNSAFVNFPKFKFRGCPPPRFCTLSKPLKERYCVKENVPASKRNKFYFPKSR